MRKGIATVTMLLKSGAKVDTTDLSGRTPLWWAAFRGRIDIARVLIQNGAHIDAWDIEGETPLFASTQCQNLESRVQMVQLLLSRGADPTYIRET